MERILQHFCTVSGRRINIEKSQILFSASVDQATASGWLLRLASRFLSNFGKYLGMPTIHERAGKDTYYFLVEKVRKKLSAWKGKQLSLATRAIIIQTLVSIVANYAIQTSLLPAIQHMC